MKKIWKILSVAIIMLVIISPVFYASDLITQPQPQKNSSLFQFQSYIELNYNSYPLNSDIPIDVSCTIPIEITYHTDIPNGFLRFLPWNIRNLILFGTSVGPMQRIHLEILNEPEWATLYLSSPDIYIDIPFGDEHITKTSNLIISVDFNAPAEPYCFTVQARCDDLGALKGYTCETMICFTPGWINSFSIQASHSQISAPAGSLTNTKIEITNTGNANILIYGKIEETYDEDWGLVLEPSSFMIQTGQTKTITFHIGIPEDCIGCYRHIQIEFYAIRPGYTDGQIFSRSYYVIVSGY